MSHYKSNLRDIEFNLFEVLRRQDVLGKPPYEELDTETVRDVLAEVNRLAVGPLADSFAEADRNPPVFDPATGTVTIPEAFKRSYRAFMDAQWWRLDVPPGLGGTGAPRSLHWAVAELVLGANPAVWMYSSGPSMAQVLWLVGTPEQQRFAEFAIDRGWTSTMVLTEPDAGSDVGAGRTRAIAQPDGTWHLEGVKRFITSAEHQLSHGPVQRPGGAGAAEAGRHVQPPPLGVHESVVGALEGVGNGDRAGCRVEHRWVAVGLGEGVRERADGQPVHLGQHAVHDLLVQFLIGGLAEHVLPPQHLEQVELDVAQVAFVVTQLSPASRAGPPAPVPARQVLLVSNLGHTTSR